MTRIVASALVFLCFGYSVSAQSSLGITGATISLGATEDEGGTVRNAALASVDVRITDIHGLEGGLAFSETAGGTVGSLSGTLYMAPHTGQKYGLFLALSDIDGRSLTWASFGAAGMLELGEASIVSGYAGLGAADGASLDYIFGGVALAHAVTPSFEIEAALDVADFDEADFRATSVDASLTARFSPEGAPWGLYVAVTRSDLTGRSGTPARTRIGAGFTYSFGTSGGVRADSRPFRIADPVAPLIRRGLR